jgi:hypothetical protein
MPLSASLLSSSAKAGNPVRRGFSIQSQAPLEYWGRPVKPGDIAEPSVVNARM